MPAKSLLQEVLEAGNSDWLFFRTLPYRRRHPSFVILDETKRSEGYRAKATGLDSKPARGSANFLRSLHSE